jgi:NADH-quinone oxidoreductase subunit C
VSDLDPVAAVEDATGRAPGVDTSFGALTIDVAASSWRPAAQALRDDPRSRAEFFDWLSAYDDRDAGLAIVVRVWSMIHRQATILRCQVSRETPAVDSLTPVWAGAGWHERETFEMFGVDFLGHPNLVPLLLPEGFEGHPLRKEFVLASRVAKDWPGQKQPGESDRDLAGDDEARRRRRVRPPGLPDPGSWGPS